jgi:hypothetical protein
MQQSLRVVRGMTWSGMFYNMVRSDPSLDADRASGSAGGLGGAASAGAGPRVQGGGGGVMQSQTQSQTQTQTQRKEELVSGAAVGSSSSSSRSGAVSDKRRAQDAALDAVSRNLEEMHRISITMGESLDSQQHKLDSISDRTDRTNDATIEVLLKSSQLIERNSSIKPIYLGEYCFELHTGGFLSVQDEQLVIAPPIAEMSTTFRCFNKGDIFSMLSRRTMKFLATGYFTPITVSGMKFNSAAHMFLDLSGEFNGILMLSCNWGSGGWLKFGEGGAFTLTSGLKDKDNRVLLRAIPLKPDPKKGT